MFLHGIVDGELSFILKHEHGERGDGLGHGGDPKQRVGGHGLLRGDVREAGGLQTEHAAVLSDQSDRTGDGAFIDAFLHRGRNRRWRAVWDRNGRADGFLREAGKSREEAEGDEKADFHAGGRFTCWSRVFSSAEFARCGAPCSSNR